MSDVSTIEAALAEIDEEIADAERRLADLRTERVGAIAFLARMKRSEPELPTRAEVTRAPGSMTDATDAPARGSRGNLALVEEILKSLGGEAILLAEIEEESNRRGHHLNNEQVRSAVSYLKRKNIAERVGRGRWRLTSTDSPHDGSADSPQDAESPAATGLSDTSATSPEEGGDEDGTGDDRDHDPHQRHRDHSGSAPTLGSGG